MCDRKDGAIELYFDAKNTARYEHEIGKISDRLYVAILAKLEVLKNNMDDSDHRTFGKDIYDVLAMKDVCSKCLLPPSEDCEICNGTQINEANYIL